MHQSCALPKLASLLSRDSYGSRYGVPMEAIEDVGLSGERNSENSSVGAFSDAVSIEWPRASKKGIPPQPETGCGEIHDVHSKDAPIGQVQGADVRSPPHESNLVSSHEKVELVVHDMPIVSTSSLENQVGPPSVADARWNSLREFPQESAFAVNGCASGKRGRSHLELEEARAEKRVKVEGDGGLPCSFVIHGNGLVPTVPPPSRGVEGYLGANKERDDGRRVSAPNDTDLTDLLNDLDDAGDDSDLEDDEFEDGSHLWPEAYSAEWLGIGTISGNGDVAHMPEAEVIAKALTVSAEQMSRDGIKGAMHSLEAKPSAEAPTSSSEQARSNGEIRATVQAHASQPEAITKAVFEQTQSNGEIGSLVQHHSSKPETISKAPGSSSEQAERNGDVGSMVQVQSSQPETSAEALNFLSEQAERDGETEIVVQAHEEKPFIVILDSDSDDDDDDGFIMFDHPVQTSPLKNAVKVESGAGKLEKSLSQLKDAVKVEPCRRRQLEGEPERQPDNRIHQMGNAAKVEPEIVRQPERSHPLENTLLVEPEILRQPKKSSQLGNAVKVETENLRQPDKSPEFVPIETPELVPNEITELVPNESSELVPRESSHLTSVVNSELEIMKQAVDSSKGNYDFGAPTMQGTHRPGQELRGFVLQTVVQDGKLMWALVPQNPDTTLGSPYAANHMDSTPHVNGLPNGLPYGLGCSSGFPSRNVREALSSGEQAGPSHSWIPPSTSADMPPYRGHARPSGMGNGNNASAGQAVVSVPRPSLPAGDVQDAAASREQVGPRHGWTPSDSSAVVPYHYDTTVSTPRVNVTRALQQYLIYINKAKDDRARVVAERESTSNEPVREGNRRGLDCRPDIVAYNDIKKANACVNPGVNVGDLPGVQVGDTFTYRHQMAIVGLHRLPNVGIDYGYPPPDMIPTATAIVMMPKAGYVDDKDWGDKILYTGQGGRKKRNQQAPFVQDQKLTKGNLALVKNFERKLPVRVIRGHFGTGLNGPGVLGYSYDGLYAISSYELADGINGYKVFKYIMDRLEDQPPIPPCIAGCTAHDWNTLRKAPADVTPLQAMDPTVDVKPICMQEPSEDVKPSFLQETPVEMKQICM